MFIQGKGTVTPAETVRRLEDWANPKCLFFAIVLTQSCMRFSTWVRQKHIIEQIEIIFEKPLWQEIQAKRLQNDIG